MSYPVIYAENATDFFNLGLGTLPDATKVEVTEERNGEFTLAMTYLVDGLRANEIKKNRIIKVDAGHVLKGQRFVIKKINKQLIDRKMQYQVYAEHVSYITNDLQLKPKVSVSGSGDAAIKAWRSNIIDTNPLVVDSDIETSTSTNWTIDKVQSARQALGGVSGSLLDLWGGEYRFDNYHISLKKQRGTVSNTLLSYGRNITDFDQEENITDTYTSIYPFATYTETTENSSDSESKLLTLSELTIDSKYVGNYPNRKILPVDLTAKFAAGEKPTEAKLREFAKSYVTANDIGVPKVSIKLSFVDLSQSSNYEVLQLLEVLDLCDTVPVRFTKLGVDTKTKVSRVVWDVLADHYTSMELGDTRYTISDMINNAVDTANEANQNSQEAQNSANHAVISADGHTMIFYGPGTPIAKNIGDIWYKPDGEYEIMYRWDGKVWAFVMSTKDTADAQKAADEASKEAEEAKEQANKAVDGANEAVAKAGFANDTADQAKSDAATATQNATTALTNAGTALTNAKNALDNVNKLDQTVKTEVTNINGQLSQKVNQTTFDTLKGTVTSQGTLINQNKAEIQLKADLSLVNTIKQTVTNNTAAIDLNSKEIKLKASRSDVDKLGGRVTNAEAQIKLQADQIKLTVSKTELTNILGDYATQTWTQSQIKSTADQINLSVSKVQTNLDNMQVGGVNYLRNSNFEFGNANWRVWSPNTPPTGSTVEFQKAGGDWPQGTKGIVKIVRPTAHANNSYGIAQDGISVVQGREYVVSFESASTIDMTFSVGDSGNGFPFQWFHVHALSHQRTQIVFKAPAGATKCNVYFGFNGNDKGTLWISRIMMSQGNKSLDWGVNPADYTSEVQFSQLQLTVNGIQGTVQNKADKSQVTQLANQITSTIESIGTSNWVYNSDFASNSLAGWIHGDYYVSEVTASMYNGTRGAGINKNYGAAGAQQFVVAKSKHMPHATVGETFYYECKIKLYGQTTSNVDAYMSAVSYNGNNETVLEYTNSNVVNTAYGTDKWLTLKGTFKLTKAHTHVNLWFQVRYNGVGTAHLMYSRPMMSNVNGAPYTSQGPTASEITQLASDINLRVQKGDVINQINISPESILIAGQKVHITGQTSIDNAVIKDAMIANVKADKITAGTINAANINVINLNANNMTTGTLKGANLSMNLNTGQVVFQKGRIHSTSNNVDVNIDQGYLSVANGNTRVLLKNGGIQFVQPTIFDETTNPYLSISNGGSGLVFSGARIVGRDYVVMANNANSSNVFDSPLGGAESFAGISAGYDGSSWHPTKIGGADRGIILSAGKKLSSAISWVGGSASIRIGSDGSSGWNSNRIELIGEYVHSLPTYVRTASGSANVIVAADGALVRSTSASKYKTDIIRTNIPDYGEKLLELPTATWMDIAETKRYRDDPVNQIKPTRNFGMIAEDLAEAGLEMLVVRGADGELEGINYDRIGPALIPVIAKLKNEVETLKQKLEEKTA
ncbi:phage tail spike protein [Latilactobacillus sakei]